MLPAFSNSISGRLAKPISWLQESRAVKKVSATWSSLDGLQRFLLVRVTIFLLIGLALVLAYPPRIDLFLIRNIRSMNAVIDSPANVTHNFIFAFFLWDLRWIYKKNLLRECLPCSILLPYAFNLVGFIGSIMVWSGVAIAWNAVTSGR